jgi:hypothetical protein
MLLLRRLRARPFSTLVAFSPPPTCPIADSHTPPSPPAPSRGGGGGGAAAFFVPPPLYPRLPLSVQRRPRSVETFITARLRLQAVGGRGYAFSSVVRSLAALESLLLDGALLPADGVHYVFSRLAAQPGTSPFMRRAMHLCRVSCTPFSHRMLADALAVFASDGDCDGLLEVEREVLAAPGAVPRYLAAALVHANFVARNDERAVALLERLRRAEGGGGGGGGGGAPALACDVLALLEEPRELPQPGFWQGGGGGGGGGGASLRWNPRLEAAAADAAASLRARAAAGALLCHLATASPPSAEEAAQLLRYFSRAWRGGAEALRRRLGGRLRGRGGGGGGGGAPEGAGGDDAAQWVGLLCRALCSREVAEGLPREALLRGALFLVAGARLDCGDGGGPLGAYASAHGRDEEEALRAAAAGAGGEEGPRGELWAPGALRRVVVEREAARLGPGTHALVDALAGSLPTLAGALHRARQAAPAPPPAAAMATLEDIAEGAAPREAWVRRDAAAAAAPSAVAALAAGAGGGPWGGGAGGALGAAAAAAPPLPFVPTLGGGGGGGGGAPPPPPPLPTFSSLDASSFAAGWPLQGTLPPWDWAELHLRVAVGAYLRALAEPRAADAAPAPPRALAEPRAADAAPAPAGVGAGGEGGERRRAERAADLYAALPDAVAHDALFCALVHRGRPLAAAQVLALAAGEGAPLSARGWAAAAALAGALGGRGGGTLVGALLQRLPGEDCEGGRGRDALRRAAEERALPPAVRDALEEALRVEEAPGEGAAPQ